MKSSLEFLDSCGTNAPAGLANEFNLSVQPFSFPIHILISCKWIFTTEAPVNKNTTCFLQLQFAVITWKHLERIYWMSISSLGMQYYKPMML